MQQVGFYQSEFDPIFRVAISWMKWYGHQNMVCHKYAKSDKSGHDPSEIHQGLTFDPVLDDRDDLPDKAGAIHPAPKLPYTAECCERFKHLPHEALLVGGSDQSWHYPLQVTIKHVQSAATGRSDA